MSADWPHCGQCGGIRIANGDSCLVHAKPEERAAVLKQFSESGDLDVRGVTISEAVLTEIFDAAPRNATGHTTFSRIQFGGATFKGMVGLGGATFKQMAWFDETVFEGDAKFNRATFETFARLTGAKFEGDVPVLGLITVTGLLDLDEVQFTSQVRIVVSAGVLNCRQGRFPGGVTFDVQRAVVRLDDSNLSESSLLTGPPVSSPAGKTGQPRLLSLQGANVAGLALGNVDLTNCRFAGAHNLDKLRLEAYAIFGLSPAVAGWERRQVIAEEAAWRAWDQCHSA